MQKSQGVPNSFSYINTIWLLGCSRWSLGDCSRWFATGSGQKSPHKFLLWACCNSSPFSDHAESLETAHKLVLLLLPRTKTIKQVFNVVYMFSVVF